MRVLHRSATTFEYRGRAALLFLSQPLLAWTVFQFGSREGHWYATELPFVTGVWASVFALIGTWIRIQAASYFSSAIVAQPDPVTDHITQTGPFSAVRNPLYLGSLVELFGFALCLGWPAAVIYSGLHAWRYHRIILHEEELFRSDWGSQFDQYCKKVPRWIPNRPTALFYGRRWTGEAILGNGPFIGLCAGIIASTWTGNLLMVIVLEVAGFLVAGLHFLLRRRTRDKADRADDDQPQTPDLEVSSRSM